MPRRGSKNFINQAPSDLPANAPADVVHVDFANRLQRALTDKGWSQAELARRAQPHLPANNKIARDNISGYIRGVALPGPIKLKAMADALGIEVAELLPHKLVPSASDRFLPAREMRDTGDGNVWIKLNRAVSWATGLKIMELITADDQGSVPTTSTPSDRPGGRQRQMKGSGEHDGRSA